MSVSATREKRSAAAAAAAAAATAVSASSTNNGESGGGGAEAEGPEVLENCGVCQTKLSAQRDPQLLPCLHSLCRGCLSPEPADSSTEPGAGECGRQVPACRAACAGLPGTTRPQNKERDVFREAGPELQAALAPHRFPYTLAGGRWPLSRDNHYFLQLFP